jgi:hypothetical protein
MANVVRLFDERWVEDVFHEGNLWVSVSTKGRVRFVTGDGRPAILTMEQMMRLGQVLSVAFTDDNDGKEDDDGNGHQPA